MLELNENVVKYLKDIIKYGTEDCKCEDCYNCILNNFNSEKYSCIENAQKLLKLVESQGKENE